MEFHVEISSAGIAVASLFQGAASDLLARESLGESRASDGDFVHAGSLAEAFATGVADAVRARAGGRASGGPPGGGWSELARVCAGPGQASLAAVRWRDADGAPARDLRNLSGFVEVAGGTAWRRAMSAANPADASAFVQAAAALPAALCVALWAAAERQPTRGSTAAAAAPRNDAYAAETAGVRERAGAS